MKKIAIIGGGIVGSTVAYYLSKYQNLCVYLFDSENGQATKAAAGIISPWLSKRRNKKWFKLATDGAALVKEIALETNMTSDIYNNSGTIITRKNPNDLKVLYSLAKQREKNNYQMGNVEILTSKEIQQKIPYISKSNPGIFIPGGSKIDGELYCKHLQKIALKSNLIKINKKVKVDNNMVYYDNQEFEFDKIIVSAGAWINECFSNSMIKFDIYPQKGQLIDAQINTGNKFKLNELPVLMPEGQYDVINNYDNHLFVGATHENGMNFDLKESKKASTEMIKQIDELSNINNNKIFDVKLGTRAYTNDFAPFFGRVPNYKDIFVASGLGSSGLTTGPLIGKILSEMVLGNINLDISLYTKDVNEYLTK
ncbi:FAD-dependent oxidoreductase [Lactobacillus sp. S2-2]|uniref:NAD(P)/FAD-dependent oxidoreductase n=1 Tax=Lactobacillus sp. S2-2 TaxID=2692917 RepID=UPI001F16ED51|nr:FAD-dependent oxidoreductase [Lactobacillus sp. S2-2]MCF6515064.1 FAD-dependent oxidoreductase [Lactobacillus sp. S2-2]